ncbi:MAG: chain-length determining protein [Proteobacteria bacterium]|nr:chain-length determining protein [Pseudomonadota bacterium]
MIKKFRNGRVAKTWARNRRKWSPPLKRNLIFSIALVAFALSAFYWLALASDRYVSTAHVIIQRTDVAGGQGMDFSSLLGGSGGNRADQLLLRDHLLSIDMLKKLDTRLNLRAHYSDSHHDLLSRMWSVDNSIEHFHNYYLSRVSVEFDDYTGVLIIKAQGYDAKMAQAITSLLVHEGELFMNEIAHSLGKTQVEFLEKQVATMNERAINARQDVLSYQNKKGLVSPQATAENIASIVAALEGQKTTLETQRSALQSYLVQDHSSIIQLNQQIEAINKQLAQEQAKLTSPTGKPLNRTVEEFQRLEMQAAFAQDVYKVALVALEKGHIEATRMIKKVSVIQAPSQPEYPLEPRRYYNTLVFMLVIMLMAGVAQLLAAIIRDHKD